MRHPSKMRFFQKQEEKVLKAIIYKWKLLCDDVTFYETVHNKYFTKVEAVRTERICLESFLCFGKEEPSSYTVNIRLTSFYRMASKTGTHIKKYLISELSIIQGSIETRQTQCVVCLRQNRKRK